MVDVTALAAAVRAHPGVARLHGGPFGTVASFLPGRRRIDGVRVGVGDEPVELAVVARPGRPLPQLGQELGAIVRGLCGPVAVEVTICDIEFDEIEPDEIEPDEIEPGEIAAVADRAGAVGQPFSPRLAGTAGGALPAPRPGPPGSPAVRDPHPRAD